MPTTLRTEIIDPARLSADETEQWILRLYAVHNEIFDGVSIEEFGRYVIRSPADRTLLQVTYGPDKEIAGYIAIHGFRRNLRGEDCTVVRAEAGLRRAFRGGNTTGSFFVNQLLKLRLEFPGQLYYLGCLVHPSSYTALARSAAEIWPCPGVDTPKDIYPPLSEGQTGLLLRRLADITGLDLSSLQGRGPLGSRYPISARTILFREGDPGDALYAVVSGTLFWPALL